MNADEVIILAGDDETPQGCNLTGPVVDNSCQCAFPKSIIVQGIMEGLPNSIIHNRHVLTSHDFGSVDTGGNIPG